MKKLSMLFGFILCFMTVLTGCSCKKEVSVSKFMGRGVKDIETFVKLSTASELEEKIENDESFFLYVYNPTCGTCKDFSEYVLTPFVEETKMEIFAISEMVSGLSKVIKIKTAPTLVVYNEGLIVSKVNPEESTAFDSVEKLKKYVTKYAYLPQNLYVNKDQLDALLESNEKFFLFFESATCGDCHKFIDKSLNPYLQTNAMKVKFYTYEVSEFRQSEEENVWQTFKDDYGLSNKYNPKGYGVGYVPTIQYIEAGDIKDMMVFYNDTEKVVHEDGTFSYQSSYYPDESPALTLHFNSYSDYQEKTFSFYNRKFVELVNTYNK